MFISASVAFEKHICLQIILMYIISRLGYYINIQITHILSFQATEAMKNVHQTPYQLGQAIELIKYNASGTSTDWAHGVAGIPYSLIIELRPCANLPPTACIEPIKGVPQTYNTTKCEVNSTSVTPCDINYAFDLPPNQIIPTGEEIWAFHVAAARRIVYEFM